MKGSIEKTNEETGKETWNFEKNKFTASDKNTFNLEKYNEEALKKAQLKGDTKTNAESGFDTWKYDYNKKIGMTYDEIEEYKNKQLEEAKKKGGSILNTNVNSEDWFGTKSEKKKNNVFVPQEYKERRLPQHMQPRKEKILYDKEGKRIYPGEQKKEFGQYFEKYQRNNGMIQDDYNQSNFGQYFNQFYDSNNYDINNNNFDNTYNSNNNYNCTYDNNNYYQSYDNSYDDNMEEGVIKIQRNEKIIEEDGIRKKVIKVVKYLENGEQRIETYKEPI